MAKNSFLAEVNFKEYAFKLLRSYSINVLLLQIKLHKFYVLTFRNEISTISYCLEYH